MVKNNTAKEEIINRIKESFGEDYLGILDKKVYLRASTGTQVALTLTCPKTLIEDIPKEEVSSTLELTSTADLPWDTNYVPGSATTKEPKAAEISDKEKENLAKLLEKLGL